ncbi:hypothetical protein DFJ73DRAFT_768844 [Zopfochytrium polystomum]|nr:hypothetical protein DFJ73DRAFT_768844 [Zopfochytrium polystomum]
MSSSSQYTSADWLDARIQVYHPPSSPPSYDERIVPRLRWLHSTLLLFDVLPTFALRELSNDVGYSVFHIAVLLYVYAILHSTPILTALPEGKATILTRLGAFQARNQTGFRLFFMFNILLVFTPPVVAVLGGVAADNGDAATAAEYVVVLMVYFVVCGLLLSVHIGERVRASREEGMEGPGLDTITASMQSVQTMLVVENVLALSFSILLPVYAFYRVQIHSTPFLQVNMALISMYAMPVTTFISYIGIFRGTRKLDAIGASIAITTRSPTSPTSPYGALATPTAPSSRPSTSSTATSPPQPPPPPGAASPSGWRGGKRFLRLGSLKSTAGEDEQAPAARRASAEEAGGSPTSPVALEMPRTPASGLPSPVECGAGGGVFFQRWGKKGAYKWKFLS